jgi:hypothetical protein
MPPLDIPDTAKIDIVPEGNHYKFSRTNVNGQIETADLTPDDILKLYQALPQFARLAMQALEPSIVDVPGLEGEVWASVQRVRSMLDTHNSVVLTRIQDEFGLESRFLFDSQLARETGEGLVSKAPELDAASAARICQ